MCANWLHRHQPLGSILAVIISHQNLSRTGVFAAGDPAPLFFVEINGLGGTSSCISNHTSLSHG